MIIDYFCLYYVDYKSIINNYLILKNSCKCIKTLPTNHSKILINLTNFELDKLDKLDELYKLKSSIFAPFFLMHENEILHFLPRLYDCRFNDSLFQGF